MTQFIDFYSGKGTDDKGRTFDDYMNFTHDEMEMVHDYIQWLFPNKEASRFNPDAPLLTDEDIEAFQTTAMHYRIMKACVKMYKFYGLSYDVIKEPKDWITPNNHNFLRITRILKFLRDTNKHDLLNEMFSRFVIVYSEYDSIIGPDTFKFWCDAVFVGDHYVMGEKPWVNLKTWLKT